MIRNNDEKLVQLKERYIAKVSNRVHYGEDEQADDKYLYAHFSLSKRHEIVLMFSVIIAMESVV